jgi:hypothetical protein
MSKKPSTVVAKTDSKPETKKEKQPKESSLTGDVGKKYKLMVQILTSDPRFYNFYNLTPFLDMQKHLLKLHNLLSMINSVLLLSILVMKLELLFPLSSL